MSSSLTRRNLLKSAAGLLPLGLAPTVASAGFFDRLLSGKQEASTKQHVVVVGAGFAGATFSIYLKKWSPNTKITVIEPNRAFASTLKSNEVISGAGVMADIIHTYRHVQQIVDAWVKATVTGIDPTRRTVTTSDGSTISYDRLVLCGGVELQFDRVLGYDMNAQQSVMHAWKTGPQTAFLRRQLQTMPDGGVFVLTIPQAPYSCPSGPYERVCTVASYFKKTKPRSKIIVLDGNPDIASLKFLYLAAWKKHFGFGTPDSMIDYRPINVARSLDVDKMMVGTEFDDVKADVINLIPPMRAAEICGMAGVRDGNWCTIDYTTFESKVVPNVHIIGDSALTNFPKSAAIANSVGKLCAYAMAEMFAGRQPDPSPVVTSNCYATTGQSTTFHVATVFRWDNERRAMLPAKNATGVSKEESELEYAYFESWEKNIINDTLGISQ